MGTPVAWYRLLAAAALAVAMGCDNTHAESTRAVTPLDKPRGELWPVRDTRLFVLEAGPHDAPTIVGVHGGPGGNHRSLLPLLSLAPQFHVVLYDQRGTGDSERLGAAGTPPLEKLSLEENVRDLEALRALLRKERVILVGHSFGGALATFYAADHPDRIEKLVVYSGGPEDADLLGSKKARQAASMTDELTARFGERSGELSRGVKRGASEAELDRLFVGVVQETLPTLYCDGRRVAADDIGRGGFWANQGAIRYVERFDRRVFASKLREVRAPALLTWGRCEPSPKERLLYLLDALPDARFVIFERSGHNAMEEERELFMSALRAFLRDEPLPVRAFRSRTDVPR